ncbi:hypothetical protein ACFL1H_01000 [Nanoarchaeota archaeon]
MTDECKCGKGHGEFERLLIENNFMLSSLIDYLIEKKIINQEEFQKFVNEKAAKLHKH